MYNSQSVFETLKLGYRCVRALKLIMDRFQKIGKRGMLMVMSMQASI
jgi:hypothetical protein